MTSLTNKNKKQIKVVPWKAGAGDKIVLFEMINKFSCDINFYKKAPCTQ